MKRQQLWLCLLLLPPMLLSCIEKKYPQVATTINGTIVDENDKPIEGLDVSFRGVKPRGISADFTFSLTTKSDKNGLFTFSQTVPNGTAGFYLLLAKPPFRLFILKNNAYAIFTGELNETEITIGKTNNLNFKFKML